MPSVCFRTLRIDEEGDIECPRLAEKDPEHPYVKPKVCREKCRYYYGRGIVQKNTTFDPLNPKTKPVEEEWYRWHVCTFPQIE